MPDRIISAQASLRAERDEIGPDERPLDRHHVAHQPDVEAEIVGEPAQQRHRRVRVRVHEAGHDDAPAAVDRLGRVVLGAEVADRENRAAGDGDRSGRVHRELLVHRQDVRVGEQQVAGNGHMKSAAYSCER